MKFHHIGIVVNDIEKYENSLLYYKKINQVDDELQNAKLSLYSNFDNSFIELIQPLNENSYTWNSLRKFGNHYHHLCYEVYDKEEIDCTVKNLKLIKVLDPTPAILFNNKLVTFYIDRNKKILEFLISE